MRKLTLGVIFLFLILGCKNIDKKITTPAVTPDKKITPEQALNNAKKHLKDDEYVDKETGRVELSDGFYIVRFREKPIFKDNKKYLSMSAIFYKVDPYSGKVSGGASR